MIEIKRIIYRLHGETAIASGYEFGPEVIYIRDPTRPISQYRDWQLRTRKVDARIANFSYDDFRLGLAVGIIVGQWDWRGSKKELISKETLRKLGQLRKDLQLDKSHQELERERCLNQRKSKS